MGKISAKRGKSNSTWYRVTVRKEEFNEVYLRLKDGYSKGLLDYSITVNSTDEWGADVVISLVKMLKPFNWLHLKSLLEFDNMFSSQCEDFKEALVFIKKVASERSELYKQTGKYFPFGQHPIEKKKPEKSSKEEEVKPKNKKVEEMDDVDPADMEDEEEEEDGSDGEEAEEGEEEDEDDEEEDGDEDE
jgi:hypothetical protein